MTPRRRRIKEIAERAIRRRGGDPVTLDRNVYKDFLDRAGFWLSVIEDEAVSSREKQPDYRPAYREVRMRQTK